MSGPSRLEQKALINRCSPQNSLPNSILTQNANAFCRIVLTLRTITPRIIHFLCAYIRACLPVNILVLHSTNAAENSVGLRGLFLRFLPAGTKRVKPVKQTILLCALLFPIAALQDQDAPIILMIQRCVKSFQLLSQVLVRVLLQMCHHACLRVPEVLDAPKIQA